jgi:branched-chain amino acid transport system substrate-binding protein
MRAIADTRWGTGQTRWSHVVHNRLRSVPGRQVAALALAMTLPLGMEQALAAGPGDSEIRIGNTMPYSGPASAYGVIGKVLTAYFDKVNAEGGINGRRIKFISYDDAYNPTKTVEATRKLVEEDNVHFIFASLGTNTSAAVQPYLNSKKIPQLRRLRRLDVGSAARVSLEHGFSAQLPVGVAHLCAIPAGEPSEEQDRRALPG